MLAGNAAVGAEADALRASGFVTVPNALVTARLDQPLTALLAAGYFSLTLGVLLSLWGVLVGATLGRRFGVLAGLLASALPPLACAWRPGLDAAALLLLMAPPMVAAVAARVAPLNWPGWRAALPALLLALPLGLAATAMDARGLYELRDRVLMRTQTGQALVSLYYRFGVYPAELMKSRRQRLVNSYVLAGETDTPRARRLVRQLERARYLRVAEPVARTARLTLGPGGALAVSRGGVTLTSPLADALSDPAPLLSRFAAADDPFSRFRRLTGLGIAVGPMLLVLLVLLAAAALAGRWSPRRGPWVLAAAVWFALAALALAWPDDDATRTVDPEPPAGAAPPPALLRAVDDPHPLIARAAIDTLAKRYPAAARPTLIGIVESSDSWYLQWKAYAALLATGWRP